MYKSKFTEASIYVPVGSKVIYAFPKSGHTHDKKQCEEFLKRYREYEIEKTEIGGFHTDFYLKGFTKPFNSVMFGVRKCG